MTNMVCPTCGLLPSPGRLAFHHRHVALSYVRKAAPDLHSEAVGHAYAETEGRGLTFDDYVARLEADLARIARLAACGLDGRIDIVEALHTAGALARGEDVREYADAALEGM